MYLVHDVSSYRRFESLKCFGSLSSVRIQLDGIFLTHSVWYHYAEKDTNKRKITERFSLRKLKSFSNLTARRPQRRWHVAGIGRILLEVNMILVIVQSTVAFSHGRQKIPDSLEENETYSETDSYLVTSATFGIQHRQANQNKIQELQQALFQLGWLTDQQLCS